MCEFKGRFRFLYPYRIRYVVIALKFSRTKTNETHQYKG